MGWNPFKSKRVTTISVATSVQRLIEDNNVPNAIKTGVMKAILRDESLTSAVIEDLAGSLGVRAERAYAYAEKSYTHGLPSGEIYSSTQGRTQVEAVIEAAENQQVLVEYSRHGPANALHIGWLKLVAEHGYSASTNQLAGLTAAKGTPVYLKDMVVVVPAHLAETYESAVLEQWGTGAAAGYTPQRPVNNISSMFRLAEPSPLFINAAATDLYVAVTYVWEVLQNRVLVLFEGSLAISLNGYSDNQNYFQAKYLVAGVAKYFMYAQGAGTYPTLDAVFAEAPVVNGSYFPFVYFRHNKQSVIGDKTTAAYKTSKKLLSYLNIDFDTVAKGVDENPGIEDVQQAMMIMAVPAQSTNPTECRYLFDYFDALHYAMDGGSPASSTLRRQGLSGLINNVGGQDLKAFVIQDSQFKMAMSIGDITKRLVAGNIGPVGTCKSYYEETPESYEYFDVDLYQTLTATRTLKTYSYIKQITPFIYERIWVLDLEVKYFVYGDYTTYGVNDSQYYLIPLDYTISKELPIQEREELYARSMHFVFNTYVVTVTKVRWYQTGFFKALLLVIAIVMIVVDGGQTLGAYLGLTGAAAIVASILITLYVLPAVFKLVVKLVGQDLALVLAIALLVYVGYTVATEGVKGAPFASTLIDVSTGLQGAVIQDKFTDLLQGRDDFFKFMEEQTKLLEASNKLLETTSFLSPFVIFGESPNDFYNRTIHSGNVGVLSIGAISSYVDIALTLPKLDETLETIGESYGMES